MVPNAAMLAGQLLASWNARDLQQFVELLSDDVVWYDPAMPRPPARGRSEVLAFAEAMLRAFPDFRYEVLEPVCEAPDGSRCAVHWRISATHTAALRPPGFAATNRQVSQEGVDLIDASGGRVTRILTCFDPIAAGEQLLAVRLRPPPGSLREWVLVSVQRLAALRARRLTRA